MTDMTWLAAIVNAKLPPLAVGYHRSPARGLCAMEMVAFMEGLPHTDMPECTCPIIATYVRRLNDALTNRQRQWLLPFLPRLVGTVSRAHEQARSEYLAWQAV